MMSLIYVHWLTIRIPEQFYLICVRSVALLNKFFVKNLTQKLEELESW